MDKTFRTILSLFIAVAAILIAVVVISVRNIHRATTASDWVNHTHALIAEVNSMVASTQSAEGALRTYLLSGETADQAAYRTAFSELAEHVEVAKALAASDPTAAADIAELETLLFGRADLARDLIAAHRAGESDQLHDLLTADAGGSALIDISQLAQQIRTHHTDLLNKRDQDAFRRDQTTRTTLYLAAALTSLILLGTAWFIRDDLAARRQSAALLQADNEQLEARVKERTAELVAANRNLKAENLESRWKNQALDHQLRYNHLIVDSISDLVFVITKARNISRVNPAVIHATGFESADLADRPLDEFATLHPAEGRDVALIDPIRESLQSGHELRDQPAHLLNRRDEKMSALLSFYPLRDSDRVVGGVVTIQLDRNP